MYYIEDFLHHYVEDIGVVDNNRQILESINSQCRKGIALTDRQCALVKEKLLEKLEEFTGDEPTRLPLRQIDRSKYIKFVSNNDIDGLHTSNAKQDWVWLKVRFPFHKKLIVKIDDLKFKIRNGSTSYFHKKGSHIHYFRVLNDSVYLVVNTLIDSNFKIDTEVLNYYKKCKNIIENKNDYISMYYCGFTNVSPQVENALNERSNLIIADRSIRYQYHCKTDIPKNLTESIAFRKTQDFYVDPGIYTLNEMAQSLKQLERLPLLVLIDAGDYLDQVKQIHNAFDFVPNNLQSVLFRDDSKDNYNVNDYIREHKLNNWVDNNTQIVYIKKSQLPKIIFDSGFTPITTLGLNSYRSNTNVDNYCKFNCDLMIFYDDKPSIFNRGYSF